MRIEQHFLMIDYSLWEVILNGNSLTPTRIVNGVVQVIAPTTTKQRLAKKNELKARGTLLMALPDKHQLKFNIYKDAKSLMEAIEKRFGGNKEAKKVQKTLLKQQYENFSGTSSESLDQIHDRLQKLISQLEILGESLSQEDINLKFLRSLPLNTNESVSVVPSVSAASTKASVSTLPSVDNLIAAIIYSFFASQSNSPQLENEDLKQIDADYLEEMDLKWQMAMLTMRARMFLQRTGRNLGANGTSAIGFDMSKCDGVGSYDWSFWADEEPTNYALMAFTSSSSSSTLGSDNENENVLEEDIKLLKLNVILRDNALVELRKKFKKAEKERDELKLTLEKFQTSLKNLSKLPESQITDKTSLGYDNQVFNSTVFDCDKLNSSGSDESVPTSLVHDRYKTGEGYHVVPPPYRGIFMPPKPNLVFHDALTDSKTVPDVVNVKPSSTKPSKELSHTLRPDASIIEDWTSNSEDKYEVEHSTQAENLKKDTQKSRGHKHSWTRKAYFIYKSLNHLIKDCDFYEIQMVQKPVWNHAMRVNHQNSARMTHPRSTRHVVPTTVLTRSRLVPLSAARPVTTVVPQPIVKSPKPVQHVVNKAHSSIRRPINHRPAPTHRKFHKTVTTVKVNKVNAVKDTKGNWIQVSHGLGPQKTLSFLFDVQGNPHQNLKDKGVIDSGCLRHMTGNISYLSDFKEINRGYVAFGGNPKGGKITGKGKIKTAKLDFNDVYFVKELKFNLFSVSHMCDKKNNVLFTDTECVVLSSDFKFPDENHVLLRVPRENNMYNVDLKNVVPSGDLT
nr:ribonuclease H-like domain-containing protein [Tanacetum cinerariifolium]